MNRREFLRLFEDALARRKALRDARVPCRLVDSSADGLGGLTATLFDTVLTFHLYGNRGPFDTAFLRAVSPECAQLAGARSVVVWQHTEGQESSHGATLYGAAPEETYVEEHGVRYLIRPLAQRNGGFFVDMRELRHFLLSASAGRRVLNTFCFTGSLGLAAARGGAPEVVQNDISRRALSWARENAALQLPHGATIRYILEDSRIFLEREARRVRKGSAPYDTVIVDPPSFGHSEGKPFTLTRELPNLAQLAIDLLAPGGTLIFTANTRELSGAQLRGAVVEAAKKCGRIIESTAILGPPSADFRASEDRSDAMRGVRVELRR